MKKIYSTLLFLGLIAGFVACEKDKDFALTTLSVSNETLVPSYESAVVSCALHADADISSASVEYALKSDFADKKEVAMALENGVYTAQLDNLQDNTVYYLRYVARNKFSCVVAERVATLQTLEILVPSVVTKPEVSNLATDSVTVGGEVKNDGGKEVTERGVVYSISANPTLNSGKQVSGSGLGLFSVNLTGLTPNTTYYVRAYAVNMKGVAYGEQVSFKTLVDLSAADGDEKGYEYVDLGLSVKWARCNVGANKPEESGHYIAWGETRAKSTYNWGTYDLCNGSSSTLTKYNTNGVYGTVDNKSLLESSDDVARVNMGGRWRLPTKEELNELRTKCTWTWISVNGVNGYKLTSKSNGKSIFLPAAGYYNEGSLLSTGSVGCYWSCMLNSGNPVNAWRAYFDSGKVYENSDYSRHLGQTVRAVVEEFTLATVTTTAVTQVTETTATTGGNVTNDGGATVTERGVVYSTSQNPTIAHTKKTSGSGKGSFSVNLTGLTANTTYYVRAYAINSKGTSYGSQVVFSTALYSTPTVTTTGASNVTTSSATISGNVTGDGGATVTERGVVYSTTSYPTIATANKKTSGSGKGSFSVSLTGLTAGTTYYARVYATNSKGTNYSSQITFTTTPNYTVPTLITSAATNISTSSASVGGQVTSDGGKEVTERGVVYSTTQTPTLETGKKATGSGTSFLVSLAGLSAGKTYYARAYAVNSIGVGYGNQIAFTTKTASTAYAYVDLGLSVKWATFNVGASGPEDSGDYFAWGETTTKTTFDWSTYQYCNGSYSSLTKYNNSSSYGTVDNKSVLDKTDDVAAVKWGGNWRMPTDAEMTELREQCTWTWTTQNGMNGYKVTSNSNSNSIFLPAVGYRVGTSLFDAGSRGNYWTSSLRADNPSSAWDVYFSSSNVSRYYDLRSYGQAVRPVYSADLPTVTTTAATQVTETSATTGGNVTNDGGATVTERGVVYATYSNPTTTTAVKHKSGTGTGSFSVSLTGLQAGTTYYVRAYAINSKGTNYGAQVTFTTSNTVVLPTVTTTSATQTSSTTATVSASVLDDGGATVTERGVVYATYSNPTTASSKVISGSGTGAFTCNLTGLQSNTTYYVRAYAFNSNGTAYGDQVGLTMTTSTGNVRYELNGGVTNDYGWQSKNDMFQACMADCGVTDLGSLDQVKATADPYITIAQQLTDVTGMLTTERWDWLEAYIMQVQNADATAYALVEGTTSPGWRYAVAAFFLESQRTGWPKTADYTQAGKVEAFMPYWKHGFANPIEPTAEWVLSAPYRQGYAFDGWYWNSSFSGSKVTTVSASSSGMLYAKWVVATSGTESGYTWVDLGLSVKWATMNVGASKPEEYGDYFAWGETEPKSTYDWSTYKWCNGSQTTLTKYNKYSGYGTVDNKTQLELSDDAARANWGGSWRMPTDAELTELREQCTWTWTTQNGIKGYKVTSKKNGNSIFLPAAGYRGDSSLYSAGSYGNYWSSSLYTDYPGYAYDLIFDSDSVDWFYYSRYIGFSVRPVCQ